MAKKFDIGKKLMEQTTTKRDTPARTPYGALKSGRRGPVAFGKRTHPDYKLLNTYIHKDLHRAFKSHAVSLGNEMSMITSALIAYYLKGEINLSQAEEALKTYTGENSER